MLALLQSPPGDVESWDQFSFSNWDCINQIRDAIRVQFDVTLPDYQVQPIDLEHGFGDFLAANQQAHTDFARVLGIQTSDISQVDPKDAAEMQDWVNRSFYELFAACERLKIGP